MCWIWKERSNQAFSQTSEWTWIQINTLCFYLRPTLYFMLISSSIQNLRFPPSSCITISFLLLRTIQLIYMQTALQASGERKGEGDMIKGGKNQTNNSVLGLLHSPVILLFIFLFTKSVICSLSFHSSYLLSLVPSLIMCLLLWIYWKFCC